MALTDSLVAGWIGGTTADVTNINNLTAAGSPASTTDSGRTCYNFNGSNYLYKLGITDNIKLYNTDATVMAWIKGGIGYGDIIHVYNASQDAWVLACDPGDLNRDAGIYYMKTTNAFNSGTMFPDGWFCIVITITASGTAFLYINNVNDDSDDTGDNAIPNLSVPINLNIGQGQASYVGDIYIWNRVLTTDEMTTLYNGGAGLSYPFTTTTANTNMGFFKLRNRR